MMDMQETYAAVYKKALAGTAAAAIALYCAGCSSSYERKIKYWDEETVVEAQAPGLENKLADDASAEDEEKQRKAQKQGNH